MHTGRLDHLGSCGLVCAYCSQDINWGSTYRKTSKGDTIHEECYNEKAIANKKK